MRIRTSIVSVAGVSFFALAVSANAESKSLFCDGGAIAGGQNVPLIVNVDYTGSHVTFGVVESEGTNAGTYPAEITDRAIAWRWGDSWSTISRTTGQMVTHTMHPGYPDLFLLATGACGKAEVLKKLRTRYAIRRRHRLDTKMPTGRN